MTNFGGSEDRKEIAIVQEKWRQFLKNPKACRAVVLAFLSVCILLLAGIRVYTKHSQNREQELSAEAEQENEQENEQATEIIADGQYPILGESSVTVEQMVSYYKHMGYGYPAEVLGAGGADSIEVFCQIYYEEATAEGVRPEVPFVQSMKETGWLQYGGDASVEQYNFAGMGTTGGGIAGISYPDVRTGVRAQVQHLKAYATEEALTGACVDERYTYVKKGCAPYVEWLGQQENPEGLGWAVGAGYGLSIVEMIHALMVQ